MADNTECNFPTCSRHPQSNGYCLFHQMYATGTPTIKVSAPVKKESTKIKEVKKELKKLYPIFISSRTICEIQSPKCTRISTCVHHTSGRGKNEVLNQSTWVASCEACNLWVEENHAEAEKMGFKNRRHNKK